MASSQSLVCELWCKKKVVRTSSPNHFSRGFYALGTVPRTLHTSLSTHCLYIPKQGTKLKSALNQDFIHLVHHYSEVCSLITFETYQMVEQRESIVIGSGQKVPIDKKHSRKKIKKRIWTSFSHGFPGTSGHKIFHLNSILHQTWKLEKNVNFFLVTKNNSFLSINQAYRTFFLKCHFKIIVISFAKCLLNGQPLFPNTKPSWHGCGNVPSWKLPWFLPRVVLKIRFKWMKCK